MTDLRCPECNSSRLIKFGRRWFRHNRHFIQQYQCKQCRRITIYPKKIKRE